MFESWKKKTQEQVKTEYVGEDDPTKSDIARHADAIKEGRSLPTSYGMEDAVIQEALRERIKAMSNEELEHFIDDVYEHIVQNLQPEYREVFERAVNGDEEAYREMQRFTAPDFAGVITAINGGLTAGLSKLNLILEPNNTNSQMLIGAGIFFMIVGTAYGAARFAERSQARSRLQMLERISQFSPAA